jgi:hypothetical protein
MKADEADLIVNITANLFFGQVELLSREERLLKLLVSFQ